MFRNPQMAAALKLIAGEGESAFYRGAIAKAILKTSERLGGKMNAGRPERVRSRMGGARSPPSIADGRSTNCRPTAQGIAALEMLNILSLFPLGTYQPRGVLELHAQMEAQKLAYDDLHRYVADMRFSKVPVEGLISMAYARERAKLIDPGQGALRVRRRAIRRPCAATPIYLSVVDREGNIVSLIQSLYQHFGSEVVVDDYGFALQNRGGLFELDPAHPNALAPRKRPFHTIIPAFMEKGDLHIGFGIMGGLNQAQAHAQFVSNVVDHGMSIQMALEAPRFTKLTFGGCDVLIENRIPPEIRDALTAKGHQLKVLGDFSSKMGGGQVVVHDSAKGVNYGASDPRKDGSAVPEPPAYFAAGGK